MQIVTLVGLSSAAATLLALSAYHWVLVRPRLHRLADSLAAHDSLLGSGRQTGLDRLAGLERETGLQAETLKRTANRLDELERVARQEVHRVGFIRYNAFSDTGSELSFALALLNREGDGVVLNSIYSREETRTYAKAVRGFSALQEASKEERSAITLARNGSDEKTLPR